MTDQDDPFDYMTRHEVKETTGLSDSDLLRMQISGELIPVKRNRRGHRYYFVDDVLRWMDRKKLVR